MNRASWTLVVAAFVAACSSARSGPSNDPPGVADAARSDDAGSGQDDSVVEDSSVEHDDVALLAEDAAAPVDAPQFAPTAPVSLGFGVTYQRVTPGAAVLVLYGGYTAELGWTISWAAELVRANLGARGVGHVYAVQGPKEPAYDSHEIGNAELRTHLAGIAPTAPFVMVVAHSSGALVANELVVQLGDANDVSTLSKIVYADLDGAGGLDAALVAKLRRIAFVYGRDPTLLFGYSANANAALTYGIQYASNGSSLEVAVPNSGCHSGAKYCLHDLLVTHRPHDPDNFDLARDYTDFVGRPVTTEYIDQLAAYLP